MTSRLRQFFFAPIKERPHAARVLRVATWPLLALGVVASIGIWNSISDRSYSNEPEHMAMVVAVVLALAAPALMVIFSPQPAMAVLMFACAAILSALWIVIGGLDLPREPAEGQITYVVLALILVIVTFNAYRAIPAAKLMRKLAKLST